MEYEEVREFFFTNGYRAEWDPLELTSDNIKDINKSIGETYQKLNEQRLTENN